MGLGDTIRRLRELDLRYHSMVATPAEKVERGLITEALNQVPVVLNVECYPDQIPKDLDGDGAIDFFEAAAMTGCCALPERRTSRAAPDPAPKVQQQRRRGSRG